MFEVTEQFLIDMAKMIPTITAIILIFNIIGWLLFSDRG